MNQKIGNQVEIPDIYKVYFKSNLVKEEEGKATIYEYKDQFIKNI